MKKLLPLLFICTFLCTSCKNDAKKEENAFAKAEEETNDSAPMEEYPFSLAQWSLNEPFFAGDLDPLDFPEIAKNLGFTGVEYVTQIYPTVRETGAGYRERVMTLANQLKEKSDAVGIENVLIMVDGAGELADPDPKKLEEAIENHKIWMDAAKVLGAHSVRANLFGELNPEKWHALSVASLKELGAYGKEVGVNIIIENHGGWSSDADKLVAVMKEVGMNTVGVLPDFGNFCVKRENGARWDGDCVEAYDMYKGVAMMMPYAKGVSAKSYAFNEEGMETKIDYPRMMQIVHDAGYEGFVGIEYEGDLEDPKKGIALTKALLEKSIDQINN